MRLSIGQSYTTHQSIIIPIQIYIYFFYFFLFFFTKYARACYYVYVKISPTLLCYSQVQCHDLYTSPIDDISVNYFEDTVIRLPNGVELLLGSLD